MVVASEAKFCYNCVSVLLGVKAHYIFIRVKEKKSCLFNFFPHKIYYAGNIILFRAMPNSDLYNQAVHVLSQSMLARRVVTRPATTTRLLGASQLQRRFIFPSRSQLQAPRPNTWLAKLRFRADGKPRSKLIALGFGEYPPL